MNTITIGAYEAKTKLATLLARVSVSEALDGLAAIRRRARRGRE